MKVLQFRCELLTDVIINQKAATEGNQKCLDFIPGSNFLGIAAQTLYKDNNYSDASIIFHSGKVRFGDAHPSLCSFRGLKVPAVMAHPKLDRNKYYIIPEKPSNEINELQLKQCREGFYHFENGIGYLIPVNKSFAIKSAYDREKRRSKDEAMFGYESINADTTMFFEVEFDSDVENEIINDVKKSLIGTKRVGRSRTAQYGLIEVTESNFSNIPSNKSKNGEVAVYADSRLIFFDNNGMPTFQPTAKQLGINDDTAEILWGKSKVITFQYAPWNFKRQTRDMDRCGIEKGSVFYVKTSYCPEKSQYVGSFNNEGFGKVIYNPEFLKYEDNYKSKFQLIKINDEKHPDCINKNNIDTNKEQTPELISTPLINFLKQQQFQEKLELETIELVNNFVKEYRSDYVGKESFASQWGNIRKIAMQYKTKAEIEIELFTKVKKRDGKDVPDAYLTHGVAKEKWDDRGRREKLQEFFKNLNEDNVQFAIINLASEMAKICRRAKNGK